MNNYENEDYYCVSYLDNNKTKEWQFRCKYCDYKTDKSPMKRHCKTKKHLNNKNSITNNKNNINDKIENKLVDLSKDRLNNYMNELVNETKKTGHILSLEEMKKKFESNFDPLSISYMGKAQQKFKL